MVILPTIHATLLL